MNFKRLGIICNTVWSLTLALLAFGTGQTRGATVLYSTGFEYVDGYRQDLDLAGQQGWVGSSGNGILTNFFEGMGQQAYVGYLAADGSTNSFYSVYRPINVTLTNEPLVKFAVRMQIVDSTSTNGPFDNFLWSIWNTNNTRLFSLDFDNDSLLISYVLDDDPKAFVSTETQYDTQGYYDLVITMNFARNLWTATLNDQIIVNAKPITTKGNALNLGDVDAVWSVRNPVSPGDNYMLFDDYMITSEALSSIPPRLEFIGIADGGDYQGRVYGEPGLVYAVEMSTDLKQWETLMSFTAPSPSGTHDFQDPNASKFVHRFYRARQGP